jgi:hypothetical protein
MSTSEFDLDRYLRASKRVDLSAVEWDRIPDHPLSESEARCLAYMMDIESHTAVFLRDLLATRASFEPEVTAFLSCWAYEELWHGEAFCRFHGAAGRTMAPGFETIGADDPYPSRGSRQRWIRRTLGGRGYASHIGSLLGSVAFRDFVSIHMAWGAVNELTTLEAYHRLIARTQHPVLVQMLQAIIKDERRHFAFYRAQARMRLARSEQARRLTRFALNHLWAPVGTGVRPQSETDFVVANLFGDAEGVIELKGMDATIAELPGLGGAELLTQAARAACGRMGVAFGL